MKTTYAPTFQFSGYPVGTIEPKEKVQPSFSLIKEKADNGYFAKVKKSNAMDTPENWDESWFANYE